jgi:hypothetical protein
MDDTTTEMRGDVPTWAAQVFEGVRRGRRMTKDQLLSLIVSEWAKQEIHVATLIERLTRSNADDIPPVGEREGD